MSQIKKRLLCCLIFSLLPLNGHSEPAAKTESQAKALKPEAKSETIKTKVTKQETDIAATIEMLGNYAKKHPLTMFAMPFKPVDKYDSESNIGKIAWKQAVDFITESAALSDGALIYKKTVASKAYIETLRQDKFWNDASRGNEEIKSILKKESDDYGVNSIVYGLYDGDDSKINLTVYGYFKEGNVVLKEKVKVNASFMDIKHISESSRLSKKQKDLQANIQLKMKSAIAHLLIDYIKYIESHSDASLIKTSVVKATEPTKNP